MSQQVMNKINQLPQNLKNTKGHKILHFTLFRIGEILSFSVLVAKKEILELVL